MSKTEAQRLADALERLLPLIERGTKGFVFTADKAGEVIADKALLRDAPALLRRWPDGKAVGEVYRYGNDSSGRPWHGIYWYDPDVDVPSKTKLYTEQPAEPERGHVVVTRTPDGHLAAVTRQDEEHRILSVIADTTSLRERIAALESGLAERDRVIEQAQKALQFAKKVIGHPDDPVSHGIIDGALSKIAEVQK